jgi:hypothetical protein
MYVPVIVRCITKDDVGQQTEELLFSTSGPNITMQFRDAGIIESVKANFLWYNFIYHEDYSQNPA